MSLKDQIMSDIKAAMLARESDKVAALRFMQAAVKNKEIEVRPKEITDQEIVSVIKKLAKQRKDGIEQFREAGRTEMAEKEEFELALLQNYLPAELSEADIEKVVGEAIEAAGASSMKDMGRVMKEVLDRTGGQADGKLVSQIVKTKLQ